MSLKPRLDELLVERGLFEDVHAAQGAIVAGQVIVGEHRETSAGKRLAPDSVIRLKVKKEKDQLGFVSRGGGKLDAALKSFAFDPHGLHCVDLGASSGGFTDCLLQNGAARVSAVDVGYAQFDWSLRNDERVDLFERTNVINIDVAAVNGPFDLAVADLSFISLERVLGDVKRLLLPGGSFISLVKPQFEVAKSEMGEGGVVRDKELHERSILDVAEALEEMGFALQGLTYSPVRGPKGNIEFLIWATLNTGSETMPSVFFDSQSIRAVVDEAHAALA